MIRLFLIEMIFFFRNFFSTFEALNLKLLLHKIFQIDAFCLCVCFETAFCC